jgi:hypothetical protein
MPRWYQNFVLLLMLLPQSVMRLRKRQFVFPVQSLACVVAVPNLTGLLFQVK